MAQGTIAVHGFRELNKAFKAMDGELPVELKKELIIAAEPVKVMGQALALGALRNMIYSPEWAEMRIGVTQKFVYMVPRRRGRRDRSRTQKQKDIFTFRMSTRAMEPALEANADEVEQRVEKMLDRLGAKNGF